MQYHNDSVTSPFQHRSPIRDAILQRELDKLVLILHHLLRQSLSGYTCFRALRSIMKISALVVAAGATLAVDLSTLRRVSQNLHGPVRVVAPSAQFARQAATGAKVKKSLNWAGAVATSDRGSAKGTITVPAPDIPTDSTTPGEVHCATFWTGVDGASAQCQSILQTGIDICAQRTQNGTLDTLARSWHQFFPGERKIRQWSFDGRCFGPATVFIDTEILTFVDSISSGCPTRHTDILWRRGYHVCDSDKPHQRHGNCGERDD